MAAGLELELFVDKSKYLERINQLDVQLTRLNQIKDDYNSLISELNDKVVGSDSDAFAKIEQRAKEQINALQTNIEAAQASRASLQRTVDQMEENQRLVSNVIDQSVNTIGNEVHKNLEAAKAAAAIAPFL